MLKEETILSGKFRRVAGDGYKPVAEIVATLKDNAAYAELQSGLMQIRTDLADADAEQLVASIEDLSSRAGNVEGASDIASGLSKVRRSLRIDTPDFEKAMEDMAEVVADYECCLPLNAMKWRFAGHLASENSVSSTMNRRSSSRPASPITGMYRITSRE